MRLELPSGGWWELRDRPLAWKQFREIPQEDYREHLLAAMTVGWSFSEPPSAEAVGEREGPDVLAALAAVNPLYVTEASKKSPDESPAGRRPMPIGVV